MGQVKVSFIALQYRDYSRCSAWSFLLLLKSASSFTDISRCSSVKASPSLQLKQLNTSREVFKGTGAAGSRTGCSVSPSAQPTGTQGSW